MNFLGNSGLRTGVVGAGSVATTAHLPTYADHPETQLVAIADLDDERRSDVGDEFSVDATYESGEQMIHAEDLDLISICTPAGTHRDLFVTAVEADCHVYCEKPMTTDIKSAEAMFEVAKESDVVTQIGYTRAYIDNYRRVLSLIDNHLLGDVRRLETYRVRPPPASDWNFAPELSGGGVVADQLGHIADFYIRLFGTTPEIRTVTLDRIDVPTVEDYAKIEFDFDGTPVETALHWTPHAKRHRNVLFGAKGLLEYNLDRLTGNIQGATIAQKYGTQPFIDLRGEFRAWWGGDNDFHNRRVHDFVDHAVAGDCDTVASVKRGLEVTRIIEAVYDQGEIR